MVYDTTNASSYKQKTFLPDAAGSKDGANEENEERMRLHLMDSEGS